MWWLFAIVFVGFDILIVIYLLRATMGQTFRALAARHPAVEPTEPMVGRRFQSFRFGIVNTGMSVHVLADEGYLHLRPARVLRWAGARDASVPWEAIEVGERRGGYRRATIGRIEMWGPAWALDLVDPDPAEPRADTL